MSAQIAVILASAGLSLVVSYAWWTKVRVWILRQRLFTVRDELWDTMREKGLLDSPAHVRVREGINALIHLAPAFSFVVMAKILSDGVRQKPPVTERIQVAEEALQEAIVTVANYLFYSTLSGLILAVIFRTFDLIGPAFGQIKTWIDRIAESEDISRAAREIDGSMCPA
jgi:hypothetical protein